MTQNMNTTWTISALKYALLALVLGVCSFASISISNAQEEERRSSTPSLNQTVAKAVTEAINLNESEQTRQGITVLDNLIANRGDRLQGYDKAIVYQVRGQFKIEIEDYRGALRDFQTAVNTGALPPESEDGLRYAIAQLHYQQENYAEAIQGLRAWIRKNEAAGEAPPETAYYLLALAYVAQDQFSSAVQPMERAIQLKEGDPDKNYYNVMNLIYSETGNNRKRATLLETMINLWPEEAPYWKQLAGAYAVEDRDGDAFAVLELAYRAGLLTKEDEIIQLIQYYSFFENAYRGAVLLEREMASGTIERNESNLILLSQLWDQSREARKAIPILQEAADSTGKGDLYFRLGRVLVADEQFVKAEAALLKAINSRQLKQKDLADAWMLLGNARFSRAGPDDIAQRNRARDAFSQAAKFPTTRRDANRWIQYINEVNRVQIEGRKREEAEKKQLCDQTLERLDDARRINQLQGRPLDDLSSNLRRSLSECGYDASGNPVAGSAAAAEEAGDEGAQDEGTEGEE